MATVARRHYLEGATKREIAAEVGVSRFKVARLLDEARASGLLRIELAWPGDVDLDLSMRLREALGLRRCVVVEAPEDDEPLLRAAIGRAAAELLAELVEPGDVLGLAWARTLVAMRDALTGLAPCPVVQLTGALARPDVDASGVELVRDAAARSGGRAHVFYAPLIAADAATARALRGQPEVADAVRRHADVTLAVVGVGAWARGLSTVADAVGEDEVARDHDAGVRAEIGGVQLDAEGVAVATPLGERLVGVGAEALRAIDEVVGLVYGAAKAPAVRAAVRGGFVTSLVTHPAMALALLGGREDA